MQRWKTAAAVFGCGAAAALGLPEWVQAQSGPFRMGERVELNANGPHWQSCVVVEPGSLYAVMRLRCEPYSSPGYSRHGGIFTESFDSRDVRRAATPSANDPARTPASGPAGSPARSPAGNPARGPAGAPAANASSWRIGQAVEMEASGHWVPCTISDIQEYAGAEPLIRVNCTAYPALNRVAGTYIVHNNVDGLRPATGRIGPAPRPSPPQPPPARRGASLANGEYSCMGVGGRLMIGLGFRVVGPGRTVDLDGGNPGTFTISGGMIRFSGGHLDGQTGRNLNKRGEFNLGTGASCGPW